MVLQNEWYHGLPPPIFELQDTRLYVRETLFFLLTSSLVNTVMSSSLTAQSVKPFNAHTCSAVSSLWLTHTGGATKCCTVDENIWVSRYVVWDKTTLKWIGSGIVNNKWTVERSDRGSLFVRSHLVRGRVVWTWVRGFLRD